MPTDKQLVARTQEHEVKYISDTYNIPKLDVLQAMWAAGKEKYYSPSRKMIYSKLREMGYVINTK